MAIEAQVKRNSLIILVFFLMCISCNNGIKTEENNKRAKTLTEEPQFKDFGEVITIECFLKAYEDKAFRYKDTTIFSSRKQIDSVMLFLRSCVQVDPVKIAPLTEIHLVNAKHESITFGFDRSSGIVKYKGVIFKKI